MKKGSAQYHLDKVKAGGSGSSAGRPRPYAKKNMRFALLFSPMMVGKTLTITPKHNYLTFQVGKYYSWRVTEKGLGVCDGREIEASEVRDHFRVIPKRKIL